eukprot:gene14756-21830_t
MWFGIPLLIYPVLFGMMSAVEPDNAEGCTLQFIILAAMMLAMAVLALTMPCRSKW